MKHGRGWRMKKIGCQASSPGNDCRESSGQSGNKNDICGRDELKAITPAKRAAIEGISCFHWEEITKARERKKKEKEREYPAIGSTGQEAQTALVPSDPSEQITTLHNQSTPCKKKTNLCYSATLWKKFWRFLIYRLNKLKVRSCQNGRSIHYFKCPGG